MTHACTSFGHLCLLHSVPRSQGLGRAEPPQPLSAAGDGLGVRPAAFRRFGGQSWVLQREMKKTPVGSSKRTRWNSSSWTPAHSWPHSTPSLSANVRAAGGASPATLGVSGDKTCALGRRAQGILHLSARIVTTLLSPLLWSHSAADPRDFAHVSEAPTSEWGHNGDTCPHLPHLFSPGPMFTLALHGLLHHH